MRNDNEVKKTEYLTEDVNENFRNAMSLFKSVETLAYEPEEWERR